MKEPLPVRAMDAMEAGIKAARQNPLKEGDPMPDSYVAWCIWNELRRTGFKVVELDAQQGNSD